MKSAGTDKEVQICWLTAHQLGFFVTSQPFPQAVNENCKGIEDVAFCDANVGVWLKDLKQARALSAFQEEDDAAEEEDDAPGSWARPGCWAPG